MAKVDIDIVKSVLKRNELDVRTVGAIIQEIEQELKTQQEENPPLPRVKKEFVIMISDPNGVMPQDDLVGWVLQLPEDDSPLLAEERLARGAYEFNQTPKGRRLPAKTIGEACEAVPARILKEQNIWVKTKEPVIVLRTDNQIPFDTATEKAKED